MFFRKKRAKAVDTGNLIAVPFINMRLQWGNKVWEATMENHFIGQLEPPDRVVLLSKKLNPPPHTHFKSLKRLEPLFKDAASALEALYEAYITLRRGEIVKEAKIRDPDEDSKPFYRKYLESEFRRFLFGGFGQKPPKPSPVKVRFDRMLIDLYENILFPGGRKPSLVSYEHFTAVFSITETEPPTFSAINEDFSTYARILTGLAKKGKIKFT